MDISPWKVLNILWDKFLSLFTGVSSNQASHSTVQHAVYSVSEANVVWIIRFPRVLLALLIGAALSVSGAALQGLFRNPLADPSLIGVSAGASLTAAIIIVLLGSGVAFYVLPLGTFLGAVATVFLIYAISRSGGQMIGSTMLLAGIAFNALAMSTVGYMTFLADDDQIRDITFWTLGSLGGASWSTTLFVAPFLLLPVIGLSLMGKSINGMLMGEQNASAMGISVARTKNFVIVFSALAVGVAVAVSGVIGFIGLVIPHIIRIWLGPDNRILIPASALLGAIILLGSDLISRTLVAPAELPIGVVTALIGAPIFLSILIKEKRKLSIT